MTKQPLKVFRETVLPSPLEKYAIYLIAPADKPNYVEMYVTDHSGQAKRMVGSDSQGLIEVVNDITARDQLTAKKGMECYVLDATADSTVKAGAAKYIYTGSAWAKTAEAESIDMVLNWDSLQNKPTSSVLDIDDAVGKRHSHNNKSELDKIGEDSEGNLTYDGKAPVIQWSSVGW